MLDPIILGRQENGMSSQGLTGLVLMIENIRQWFKTFLSLSSVVILPPSMIAHEYALLLMSTLVGNLTQQVLHTANNREPNILLGDCPMWRGHH